MESKIKEEVETPEVAPVAVPEDKPVEEPAKEEPEKASEEKTENANLAIENAVLKERLRNAEEIAKLTKENAELTKVKEVESSKTMVVEKTPEVKDKTKGVISSGETEEKDTNGYVVEKAETGKGFALYKDYSKTKSGEFNRLVP